MRNKSTFIGQRQKNELRIANYGFGHENKHKIWWEGKCFLIFNFFFGLMGDWVGTLYIIKKFNRKTTPIH